MKISKMSQDEKLKYMTTAPIPGLVGKMAVPTIISMLVTAFYNMVDTAFVGGINTQATAAVGVAFSAMAIIQAVGFLFGHGSGNYVSRKLGSKEFDKAETMASTGFFASFIVGIVIGVLGIIFLKPLSYLLGSTSTILPYTMSYLGIILLGTPFMTSSFVLNNQLRFQGNASLSMIGIIIGAVFNVILDPLLIIGFDMGVAGAAIATVLSQIVSFCVLLYLTSKGGAFKISFKKCQFNMYYLKNIVKGGIPSLCRQGLASVAAIAMNKMAGYYGANLADEAIAAMGVVTKITMFANSALIGFGQGFQPVCGINYGAKNYRRVKEAFIFCVKMSIIFLTVISLIVFIFAGDIVGFFRDDVNVIEIGELTLRFQCISFPFCAVIVMVNMMLQTIGRAAKASIVASARQGIFFIPLVFILPLFMGLTGVQICQMVADLLAFALAVPLVADELKKMAC